MKSVVANRTFKHDNRSVSAYAVVFSLFLLISKSAASSGLGEYDQPWEICALCHSLDGNSRMAKFPKLAGQRKEYIEKQLHDFLDGRRRNDGGQMSSIVTEVEPADFGPIAEWFSVQEPPPPQELDPDKIALGKDLFLKNGCGDCHDNGKTLSSLYPVPLLSAQHAAYLVKQLNDFQRKQRKHINEDSVTDAIASLSQSELMSLSAYLAATPRR